VRLAPNKHNVVLLDCAGVINDLGLPTTPIRPKQEHEVFSGNKAVCSECESKRIYRKVMREKAYKICAECGYSEVIESQTGYECEACGKIHGNDANFLAFKHKLNLACECGHFTVVSEATSHDELKVIFDKQLVETLKRRVTATYCTWLINNHGTDFIFRDEVKRQIEAINILIEKHPEDATGATVEKVEAKISNSPEEWRLISEYDENKMLPPPQDIKTIEASFYSDRSFIDAIKDINALLVVKGKEPLKKWVIDKTMQQIQDSKIQGIEAMTVKRLKNLYSNDKDCNSIDTFVPYIEKQRA
jgi:hypothetical protein